MIWFDAFAWDSKYEDTVKFRDAGHVNYLHMHSLGYEQMTGECSFSIKGPLKLHWKR